MYWLIAWKNEDDEGRVMNSVTSTHPAELLVTWQEAGFYSVIIWAVEITHAQFDRLRQCPTVGS